MTIRVCDIRRLIEGVGDDRVVVLAETSEGDAFRSLGRVSIDDSFIAGDVRGIEGFEDVDEFVPVLVLWPSSPT